MTLEPIFGKVFIKRISVPKEESLIWTSRALPDDEGTIVHAGSSKTLKKGDHVKFSLRGASEIQFETDFVISIDEQYIMAIIT